MSESEPKTNKTNKTDPNLQKPGNLKPSVPEQSALIRQIINELSRVTTVLSGRLADLELPHGSGYHNPEDGIMRWCFSFETGDPEAPPLYRTSGSTLLPDLMCPDQVAQAGRVVAGAVTLLVVTPMLNRVERAVQAVIEQTERDTASEPDYPILMGPDQDRFAPPTDDPDDHV